MPNSVWDISLLLLGESDTYEPDYHTHDESICRQQAVLAEEDAHQARRNGSGTDFSEIVCECRTFRFHGFPRKIPENRPRGKVSRQGVVRGTDQQVSGSTGAIS